MKLRTLGPALAAMAVGWIIGAVIALVVTHGAREVPCPAEDSCTVDYHDGAWHIGEAGSRR
jgi:hypothetical protein